MSDWYYAVNNEQKGPVNESELKADLASSKIPSDTLVWKDGMDNWTPANQVPAFSFRQPPAPAAVQPGAAPAAKADPSVDNPDSTKPVDLSTFVGPPQALEVSAEDAEAHKIFGILAYLGPLCFLPLASAKDSPFARYHMTQGFNVFLLWFAICVLLWVVGLIVGTIGGIAGYINAIFGLLYIAPLVLMILGIINAAAGKCVPLPVIGGLKILK